MAVTFCAVPLMYSVMMIQTQRAYEMNSKAISTSDQMLAKLNQI